MDLSSGPGTRVVVGRQAVFDLERSIMGYELLFRGVPDGHGAASTGDQMTAEVLFGAMVIGLDHLTAQGLAFCNADRGVLLGEVPVALPPERTVIEVLETVRLDRDVLDGCRRLVSRGYALAVDDIVWQPGIEELLSMASIVKVDLLDCTGRDLDELVARCKDFDVRLLAEKVEHLEQVEPLIDQGFTLFQGYALERPVVISGATIEPSRLSRLRTAGTLLSTELDMEELEEIVRVDPALALQVIQLASVGRMGETRRRIGSLHEALVLVGTRRLRNWLALLLARSSGTGSGDAFTSTLIRARACELLAGQLDPSLSATGFAAGMLSALDVLLGVPLTEIASALPLTDELCDAAFGGDGALGRVVSDAVDFQLGRPNPVRRSGLPEVAFQAAFASAVGWAAASSAALDGTQPRTRAG